MKSESNTLTK